MYKVRWDQKNNGVLLSDKIDGKDQISPPRPVFFEELNLLGFSKYWDYLETDAPLLWAIGRRYFYRGECIAEANGGNIYERPRLTVTYRGELKPIDLNVLVRKNRDALYVIQNEAIDFVQENYKSYKNNVDYTAVAFSGGKDSQVVLDIVSRVLAPNEYIVIFTDTGMEIPFTYENVSQTKEFYQLLYPELKFFTAKPPIETLELWNKFGVPSRIHRWCCSVCKTAPFTNFIRKFHTNGGIEEQPTILVFEGVRSDESERRSNYKRITSNLKNMNQINAEIILYWNLTEIYLYLFQRRNNLLNKGYRYGLNRIGCSVCPYGSNWSEMIMKRIASAHFNRYLEVIKNQMKSEKNNGKLIREYLSENQWKKRSGGRGISTNGTSINFVQNNNGFKGIIKKPSEDIFEWFKILGDVVYQTHNNKINGQIKIDKEILNFHINRNGHKDFTIIFNDTEKHILIKTKIKKVLNKITHCIHCGVCEAECPTGALQVNPILKINTNTCIHCSNCISFSEKGCLRAKSLSVTEGELSMKTDKVATSKYQTFGMREDWLIDYLHHMDNWFEKNKLGNRQVQSMVAWLRDAELMDKEKNPTPKSRIIKKFFEKNNTLMWMIIWTDFFYNIPMVKWYQKTLPWNEYKSSKELIEMIVDSDDRNKPKTTFNGINSLFNMFENSPLGKELGVGIIEKKGSSRFVKKVGTDEIHPIAIAYSLYRFAEDKNRYECVVSEFYNQNCDGGPYILFGLTKEKFKDNLRYIQEYNKKILRIDLTADLENIFLREDLTPTDILKMAL